MIAIREMEKSVPERTESGANPFANFVGKAPVGKQAVCSHGLILANATVSLQPQDIYLIRDKEARFNLNIALQDHIRPQVWKLLRR